MKRKLFSILLAVCMLISVSVSAFYAGEAAGGSFSGLYLLDDGSMLIADVWNKVIWQEYGGDAALYAGKINTLDASGEPVPYYFDAANSSALFMEPWAIVPFLEGYAVSDAAANVVRYVTPEIVHTLAGNGEAGSADGIAGQVRVDRPTGLAVDGEGVLYIADSGNGAIRRMGTDGQVTTVCTGLSEPTGLCWKDGALYIAETGRSRILCLKDGEANVVAGAYDELDDGEVVGGFADGDAASARFDRPQGVAVGDDGAVYVADTLNHAIRVIRDGRVYTVAESVDTLGMPASPRGVAVKGTTLYVADLSAGDVLTFAIGEKTFSDVPASAWYAGDVAEAVRRGLIQGTTDTTFSPTVVTSRAMFAVLLSRVHRSADHWTVIDGDGTFPDLPESSWYSPAARWCIDSGIVNGAGGMFLPNADVTREQAVTMLFRYAQAQGLDVSAGEDTNILSYNDALDVSEWARAAFQWACGTGVIQGSGGNLNPASPATRAELVRILLNFMEYYGM